MILSRKYADGRPQKTMADRAGKNGERLLNGLPK